MDVQTGPLVQAPRRNIFFGEQDFENLGKHKYIGIEFKVYLKPNILWWYQSSQIRVIGTVYKICLSKKL